MNDLEKKIQGAADKLTNGINKGADYLTQLSEKLDDKASTLSENISSSSGSFKCPSCGSYIPDDSTKLVLTCPFCGTTVTKSQSTTDKVIGVIKDPIKQYQDRKAKEEEERRETRRKFEEERKKHPIKSRLALIIIAFAIGGYIIFGVVLPHQERVRALEALVVEIKQDIENGNYEVARAKTKNVVLNDDVSSSQNERWDRERETLIALIDAAQKTNVPSEALVNEEKEDSLISSTEVNQNKKDEHEDFHSGAIQALEVALTNERALDVLSKDGFTYDESKFHDYSYKGDYRVNLYADGSWSYSDNNTAEVENIYMYNESLDQMIKVTATVSYNENRFSFKGKMIKAKPAYINSAEGTDQYESKTTGWLTIDPDEYDQPYFIVPAKLLNVDF